MCDTPSNDTPLLSGPTSLADYQAERERFYRYAIRGGKYSEVLPVGRGYPWSVAEALRTHLDAACSESRPSEDTWTKPLFSIHGIGPAFAPVAEARIGDVATWKTSVKHETSSEGCGYSVERYVAGEVIGLPGPGAALRIRTMEGDAIDAPPKTHILPIAQFDRQAVWEELARRHQRYTREGLWGAPWGFFDNPQDLASALTRHLVHPEAEQPSAERAATIIETISLLEGHRPAPVDRLRLQRELDMIAAPCMG